MKASSSEANKPQPSLVKRSLSGSGVGSASVSSASSSEEGWQCGTCTFHNKASASFTSEMCQASRSVLKLAPPAPAAISRHESEPVELLRRSEEEDARVKWQRIVDYCYKKGDKFVDDSFPPAARSLHSGCIDGVQWLRPSQIVSSAASHIK